MPFSSPATRPTNRRRARRFLFSKLVCDYDASRGHARHFPIQLRNGSRLEKEAEATLFAALGEKTGAERNRCQPVVKASEYLRAIRLKGPDADAEHGCADLDALAGHRLQPGIPERECDGSAAIGRESPCRPIGAPSKCRRHRGTGRGPARHRGRAPGTTSGNLSPLFKAIGVLSKLGGGRPDTSANELAVTAGWGHFGKAGVVMPAKGKLAERQYSQPEADAIEAEAAGAGECRPPRCGACWAKPPAMYISITRPIGKISRGTSGRYYFGGYQVIKKWLSYREDEILAAP